MSIASDDDGDTDRNAHINTNGHHHESLTIGASLVPRYVISSKHDPSFVCPTGQLGKLRTCGGQRTCARGGDRLQPILRRRQRRHPGRQPARRAGRQPGVAARQPRKRRWRVGAGRGPRRRHARAEPRRRRRQPHAIAPQQPGERDRRLGPGTAPARGGGQRRPAAWACPSRRRHSAGSGGVLPLHFFVRGQRGGLDAPLMISEFFCVSKSTPFQCESRQVSL
jgi:hypothetical protein